ncbi:aldolase/citrate lyase family protein [Rhodococcus kroppenstedtii]|uniref:Aldolase n=1 Tax=Rhodococcoides kroppenstedtii TaxID=293050 RepID=A0A1I0U3N3_9NOCA|nr:MULTISPECIES: aldolase/citrate lyase family protein [Rhodococcus]AMY18103.1 5-keto-4-deoxy-D-glucarate aldolase [Rhodococcus sp. PBTS 1]MBY6313699.1 aldolase [Rhodococcus kroppenstedtii]MBY6320015.1 aldolase [Rhodococcus kroppenstedtii]MBY6398954.1 aldolase [Rhodococcus kroppenstedtii]MDV7198909.1 aldolase/citrate lyase family protein [Rhodococcus kroppenstedtii]
MSVDDFARRLRAREQVLGYWSVIDSPVSTEWLAHVGWDYLCLDLQHGLIGYDGLLRGLTAVDAAHGPAGLVRVEANDRTYIGKALDAGARGVIVPLIDTAEDAALAVSYSRYPPVGVRSYGPMRSQLRVGPLPAEANDAVVVLAMIETPEGLENVESICAVPGLDGIYVGPSDLRIAVGGSSPADSSVDEVFDAALVRIADAAAAAGIACGIHTPSGEVAARRLTQGFTFATVASDLTHLKAASEAHLVAARG